MKTIAEFDSLLPDEDACKRLLVELRWPDGVRCPRCGNRRVYALKARPFHWVCKSGKESTDPDGNKVVCKKAGGYRFSIITHTIFQDTKIPLKLWFKVAYLMLTAKKGISALQVHRVIFGEDSTHDYRTSWFMCMRLRAAMRSEVIEPLGSDGGTVEIDETWIGGKDKNRHWRARSHVKGPHLSGKTTVIGAISRKGNVICQAVEEMGFTTMEDFVKKAVSTRAKLVATDEHTGYRHLRQHGYQHKSVNHSKHTYVTGTVHTQTIESFWSLLKRGIMGSYHHVTREYLPLYVNEFAFRFNHRGDPAMFEKLLQTV
jgi:DNA-directed RNA polymerase subunit RPC12/RpoP